jgi:hypothetical protein
MAAVGCFNEPPAPEPMTMVWPVIVAMRHIVTIIRQASHPGRHAFKERLSRGVVDLLTREIGRRLPTLQQARRDAVDRGLGRQSLHSRSEDRSRRLRSGHLASIN